MSRSFPAGSASGSRSGGLWRSTRTSCFWMSRCRISMRESGWELRSEVRAIQSRLGITAIHVTHDREEAMVMADRMVVLNDGRIEQDGTPEEVYHRPASRFVAAFMGADNVVRLAVRRAAEDGLEATFDDGVTRSTALLPLGPVGAHLVGSGGIGSFDAHFRAQAARLAVAGEAIPDGTLALPATISDLSYPGGTWRYNGPVRGTIFRHRRRTEIRQRRHRPRRPSGQRPASFPGGGVDPHTLTRSFR